jgi:RNA polymerase sigma-70 factor, ECF subfamily
LKDEQSLIKACTKGDGAAFEALYQRFAPKLLVVCNRYAPNSEEAKDLLQEGFIKIFQQIHTFRNDGGSFEGWMKRIMVNTALEQYRKMTREREQTGYSLSELTDYNQPIASQDIISQINFDELLSMVQELSPSYRMVFNLYVFEGMKHHEIATQLGITEGTSKSNLSDARRLLQQRIEKVMFDI